jgi:hypothetical protein
MPVFYLEPKKSSAGDRSWEATFLREGCWVEAETELVARERVAGATLRMMDVKPGQPLNVRSPWIQNRDGSGRTRMSRAQFAIVKVVAKDKPLKRSPDFNC